MGDRLFWYYDIDHLMYKLYREKVGSKMDVFVPLTFLNQHLQWIRLVADIKTRMEGPVFICALNASKQVE